MGKKYQRWIHIGALFLIAGVTPFSWGQSVSLLRQQGMQAYQAGQADSCAYFLMEAAKGYAQTQQWDSAAWCYNYVLYVYNSQESFLESIRLGQQGLAMLPKTGYLFVRMAMMMAYAQEKEGRLVAAYDTYEQAYLTCIKEQHYDATLGSFLYRPLATLATRFGEYERAKGLLQEWLFQLQETNQNEAIQQEAISNLSIVWLSLEQPDSALVLINEALRLKEGTPLTRGQIYTRLAEAQLAIQNFKEGTEAAQTATRLLQGVPPEEATWQLHNRVAYASAAWLVTGELFEAQLEEDMANQAYLNALSLHDQLPTKVPDRQRAKILVKIARLTHKQGELDVGKKYYQAALASLTGQVGLSALDSTTVFAENTFYEVLPGLARVYEQEQQYDSARWALRWGLVAGQALWQSLSQESAKLQLSQSLHSLYGDAVRLAMQEGDVEEALRWHEAHRAAYLQENAARNQLERQYLPDSLLQLTRRLKASLQLSGVSDDQRFTWSQAYDTLQAFLQTHYPAVTAATGSPALQELQAQLAQQEEPPLVVCYAWYPPYLYGWGLSADTLMATQWIAPDLPDQLTKLVGLLTQVEAAAERPLATRTDYFQRSSALYRTYIQPFLMEADPQQPILFLPDGALQSVPLEVLLTDSVLTAWQEAPYLMRDRSVGYLPALQWLLTEAATPRGEPLVALAAEYPDAQQSVIAEQLALRAGEVPLPFARQEVEQVTQGWSSQAIFSATEEDFRTVAPQAGVLHLAMHAYTNLEASQQSGLQFTPPAGETGGFLSQAELQAIPLQARLVTLSACNTGVGTPVPGEGPLSLARSFLQAGADGVTMSLWRVPDRETAQLMEGYYALLAEGLAPTQALRHAKLKYLDQVTDPLRAHPFFWAGFVHTGQDAPLSEELSGMWLTVLGVLLAGLMVGVVLYRRIEK